MALRKEPQRRYAGVQQFAGDIGRSLDDRPVHARPETIRYRSAKFVRRHRLSLTAGLLLLLTLSVGIVVSQYQARLARDHFNEVRSLANRFIFDVHDELANVPGSTKARNMVVATATDYLDRLARQAKGDTSLLGDLAAAYDKLAQVQSTQDGRAHLGCSIDAAASERKAIAIYELLALSQPEYWNQFARGYAHIGRVIRYTDRRSAREAARRASEIVPRLLEKDPSNPQFIRLAAETLELSAPSMTTRVRSSKPPNRDTPA